jgi:hypothetical protein
VVDHELPAIDDLPADWPKLSPAGVQPVTDENSALQRDHV